MRLILTTVASAWLAAILTIPAFAGERAQAFTEDAFKAAQTANQPILVDITASWCPTCRRQGEIVDALLRDGKFDDLVIFEVDYDKQKDMVRAFRAPRQSTLVVFRGETETGRAVAITDEGEIESLLSSAYVERERDGQTAS